MQSAKLQQQLQDARDRLASVEKVAAEAGERDKARDRDAADAAARNASLQHAVMAPLYRCCACALKGTEENRREHMIYLGIARVRCVLSIVD